MKYQEEIIGDSKNNIKVSQVQLEKSFLKPQKNSLSRWAKNKMGAFWVKTKGDNHFLSGVVEFEGKKIPVCIFKNKYQEGSTPHFQMYRMGEE